MLRNSTRLSSFADRGFHTPSAETDLEGARTLAERAREHILQPFEGTMRTLTASLGVSAWQPQDSVDTLLHRADRALYAAKTKGRNRVETA